MRSVRRVQLIHDKRDFGPHISHFLKHSWDHFFQFLDTGILTGCCPYLIPLVKMSGGELTFLIDAVNKTERGSYIAVYD